MCVCVQRVGGGGGRQTFVWDGGQEDGIAMIFFPSHLLCTIKSQMWAHAVREGGGGAHSYATVVVRSLHPFLSH